MIESETQTRERFRTSKEYKELVQETDLFKRRINFLAFFTMKLKEYGGDAILVGGEAIDVYTGGTFATSDIDLVVDDKTVAERLLNRFGFGKEANGLWLNKDLNIVIQVITESYSGDTMKVRKFKIKEFELKVAAPVDLIQNRLYSAKFWKSYLQLDLEQSIALLKLFEGSIDNEYLDKIAKKNDIEDYLAEARKFTSAM
jgi:hypothetical protein